MNIAERNHSGSAARGLIAIAIVLFAGLVACGQVNAPGTKDANAGGTPPDIAGVWLPDASRAEPWPAELPLTPVARSKMDAFNPVEHDPAGFCMPLGTPRNMLQTEYPLEIIQKADRVVMVLQPNLANTEVRRVLLDGQPFPEMPDPSWYGISRGKWEGSTLVVETIGLRPDALVSGNGLAHSESLRVIERISVTEDAEHGKVLVDELELQDPMAFQQPLKTKRYFVWAPKAQLREPSSCIELEWIDKLWRQRLEEHATADRKAGKPK